MALALNNIKISQKLPVIMSLMVLLNVGVVLWLAMNGMKTEATQMAHRQMENLARERTVKVDTYLKTIQDDLMGLATNDYVRGAITDYNGAWAALEGDQMLKLQGLYITNNPNPLGKKDELDAANDGSLYSQLHAKYHPWFRQFLRTGGYYDIFLFNAKGDIVYTVFKELDFATNVMDGQWKDTDIGNAFRAAKDNPKADFQAFFDFKPYAPSANVPAGFIVQPVLDKFGNFMGAIAFQMPIDRINETVKMTEEDGKTTNMYILGSDQLLRTAHRFSEGNGVILKEKIDEEGALKALAGEKGVLEMHDQHTGNQVMMSFGPIDFMGTRWGLVAEIELTEIMKDANHELIAMLQVAAATLLAALVLSILVSRSLSKPITNMVASMKKLADGDNTVAVPSLDRGDEIGAMAKAVQVFKENAIEMERMAAEQEKLKIKAEEEKRQAMLKLADDFDGRTAGLIRNLASSSTTMQNTAMQMTSASEQTSQSSTAVAAAAEEADANVQTVAAAAEELASSSQEIARQISDVAKRASTAADEAQATSRSVQELNTLADSIGEVVSAIKDIADQTNLLALNATIEAARAGAAGKGFAVVADEVKKLATETGQKTEEIDTRVARIQGAIRASVEAMSRIIENVQQIDHATSSVASAVEEQNAATGEIGRNVTEASTGTAQVSRNILEVQNAANQTGQAAQVVLGSANELGEISKGLQTQIADFLGTIRGSSRTANDKGTDANIRLAAE